MSTYRRKAIEYLPELRDLIQQADSPTALWIDVADRCHVAYENGEADLIDRIYAFADWCLASSNVDVASATAIGFYEHLTLDPLMRADIPRRFSHAQFHELKSLFAYHLDEKRFADLEDKVREADKTRDWWRGKRAKKS